MYFLNFLKPHYFNKMKNSKGQALIEYMIVVSLVSVTAVAVLRILSTSIQGQIRKTTQNIQSLSKKTTSPNEDNIKDNEEPTSTPF